jgi:hypothetical protein
MPALLGTPSDEVPEILATGRTDITTIYASMSARHPQGRDAEYIEWHGLDHEPDQHRLPSLRASMRLVSTPDCRRARSASDERYDSVDHVMTYLFTDIARLDAFDALNLAMANVGRNPYLHGRPVDVQIPGMPLLERGAYQLAGMVAAPRIKVGADVLPWWPARGVYLLVERGQASGSTLIDAPGVAGAWWGTGLSLAEPYANIDNGGLQITYCFLDGDPAETGEQLRAVLDERWHGDVTPLLAAPFHTIVRYDWGRYLP